MQTSTGQTQPDQETFIKFAKTEAERDLLSTEDFTVNIFTHGSYDS